VDDLPDAERGAEVDPDGSAPAVRPPRTGAWHRPVSGLSAVPEGLHVTFPRGPGGPAQWLQPRGCL